VAVGLYGIVFLLVGLILGVLIGAILFRAGVSLANKVLGPQAIELSDKEQPVGETFINAPVAKNANPYAAPASPSAKLSQANTAAIPEPNMGKACGIVLVHALIAGMINFFVYLLLQDSLAASLANLILGFLLATSVYSAMLPTTFGRAALVYVFQMLIALAIGIGIAAIVYVIWLGTSV